jgi:hypothetical protein
MHNTIQSTSLLCVEGKDECNFFSAILEQLNITKIQLWDIGGKDKFHLEFPVLCNLEGFSKVERIGFIRDAETEPAKSAFSSICSILKKMGLPTPSQHKIITEHKVPRIGVLIMPDNVCSGTLESLCLEVLKTHPIKECLDNYITCLKLHQNSEEKEHFHEPKARVQAYLASRSPIRNSLGLGAMKGYWDFSHNCFDDIRKFLKLLFL